MKKNVRPSVVDFVRKCCTSFVRWDLLRGLHSHRAEAAAESLARAVGTSSEVASSELDSLDPRGACEASSGRLCNLRIEAHLSPLARALDAAVPGYGSSRQFRFALVYVLVRASHSGDVLD